MANLLLVDDDLDLVEAFAEVLRRLGHTLRVAKNGREGLALLADAKPDLIITDVDMPILNGPDMALQILAIDAGTELIPIVLTSGSPDLLRVAAEVATPYFLAKPFAIADLVALLQRALSERIAPHPQFAHGTESRLH